MGYDTRKVPNSSVTSESITVLMGHHLARSDHNKSKKQMFLPMLREQGLQKGRLSQQLHVQDEQPNAIRD